MTLLVAMHRSDLSNNRFARGLQYFLKRYRREERANRGNVSTDVREGVCWGAGSVYFTNGTSKATGFSVAIFGTGGIPTQMRDLAPHYDSDEEEAAVAGRAHR